MGDSVMYTFDASPANRAWGRIAKMASVGKERTEGSKVKTFEVEASVDSILSLAEPGLSTRCHIYLEHIPDTIVVPSISIFDRDSVKVVYVKKEHRYEERPVVLGVGSPQMTIIASGLHEGEQIALIKPKGY
jgi:multidrug efflux pump subunit AcrA (membrane-fusion protein)